MLFASATTLFIPWLVKTFIKDALISHNSVRLNLILGFSLIVVVILALSEYGHRFLMNYLGQRVIFDLRNEVFAHLLRFSLKFYKDQRRGTLISTLTNDIALLQHFILNGIVKLVKEPLIIIGAICILFSLHWKLTIVTFLVAPLIVTVIIKFGRGMKKVVTIAQQKIADVTSVLEEVIWGIKIVKLFTMEEAEKKKFEGCNKKYFDYYLQALKFDSLSAPIIEMMSTIGIILVLWYGGYEVVSGRLKVEELIAFVLYLGTISVPIKGLSSVNLFLQQASVAAGRIFELLDKQEILPESPFAKPLPPVKGKVKLEDVSFAYENELVLNKINLTIEEGEVVAIVGPSGAGKTTLINLICRLYDVTYGSIKIDDYDIREITIKSLHSQVGVVPQETMLFSGTVAENIGYGKLGATLEEIKNAAIIAHADEFIIALPAGYGTYIGEKGVKLSGGQRQRLAIARAILGRKPILIMDEATSSLDTTSEKLVQVALAEIMQHQTTIIIAHRLSTVMAAHRLIVLDKGEVSAIGTHIELLTKSELYKRLYELQFKI